MRVLPRVTITGVRTPRCTRHRAGQSAAIRLRRPPANGTCGPYIDARDGAQAVLRALAYDKPGFDNFIIEGVADANATGPVDPGPTASRLARGRLTRDWDEEITRSQTDGQLLEFAICAPQGVLFPGHCGRVSHDIAEAEGRRPRRRRCRVRAPIPAAASPAKSYPGRWDDASSSRCSPIDKCRFCGLSDVG